MEKLIELAYQTAMDAHRGQKDKSGVDYFNHCIAVASHVRRGEATIVALLHDVIEDTDISYDDLVEMGIPEHLVEVVWILTRKEGQSYKDYIEGVKKNKIAVEVKLSDLKHNMDLTRLNRDLEDKDLWRVKKYHKYYLQLLNV